MSEKGFFGGFERLGHGLFDLAIGIGAVALGIRFFKESLSGGKKKNKPQEKK